MEYLDSGFRRNDEFYGISTFYEIIKDRNPRIFSAPHLDFEIWRFSFRIPNSDGGLTLAEKNFYHGNG
ncbi:MAG: hypothetical protein NTX30_21780, partial [Deltaproteobacteria bacterium]|nr:hypothetical protein [Deltaproteobacteria bacterium]